MRQFVAQPPHAFPEFQRALHRLFCPGRSFHKLSRVPRRVQLREAHGRRGMAGKYDDWTQQQLIARIQELESQIGAPEKAAVASQEEKASPLPFRKAPKAAPKPFDASRYSTRLIALKFAYLGQKYNGFEHHKNNSTPLPTVEEELWKALVKTRLISPVSSGRDASEYAKLDKQTFASWERKGADVNWDGCEYSKCGRTDRGVSAFGQVIGVRVRSNRPLPASEENRMAETREEPVEPLEPIEPIEPVEPADQVNPPFNDLTPELPYIQLLNRVLPPDIRIYAWCPNPPPGFDARFSCKERRYKYFFTNPCFLPVPGACGLYTSPSPSSAMREGWLDIGAMQAACSALIGLHDFRNFCKIDASKQLTNFTRRIYAASIEPVSPLAVPRVLAHTALSAPSSEEPQLYAFTLHGSAFLWHQVRSIVAILFLIGQGLEPVSLVRALLDISANPTRPKYEMASDAPLVLWDCIFPRASEAQSPEEREEGYVDALEWVYVGDEGAEESKSQGDGKAGNGGAGGAGGGARNMGRGKWGRGGVLDDVWEVWRGAKVEETLAALLLDRIAAQGKETLEQQDGAEAKEQQGVGMPKSGPRIFDGGDVGRAKGHYIPVLERERQEAVEVVNERYARRKGLAAAGNDEFGHKNSR